MIKNVSDSGVTSHGISPIRGSSKRQMTPLKMIQKTSRKDQGADVHAICSTPNRMQVGNPCSSWNSPSDSFPCSQDNRPDVIWDYTSPKLPKGAKKKEIKITVDEFLKSLNHNQAAECNTQNSHYIRLLEKWMAKQNTPVIKKPIRPVKRDYKMRSRRVFEDIKQFMETMQQSNAEKTSENTDKQDADGDNVPVVEHFNQADSSGDKASFLDGDNDENDSLEELWGDSSFIVKATQHLDVSSLKYNAPSMNTEMISTIPETVPSVSTASDKNHENQNIDKVPVNKALSDSDHQAQILLTQIMSCDWDSDSDFEDFEKGFIMGDDDFSLIPDEILSGASSERDKATEKTNETAKSNCFSLTMCNKALKSGGDSNGSSGENGSCEISFGYSESDNVASNGLDEVELFNNFEDESFSDESILCKPEVLSWIDEVESKLSQSQKCSQESSQMSKCTPDEIEKKKDEAIQRLKRNKLRRNK